MREKFIQCLCSFLSHRSYASGPLDIFEINAPIINEIRATSKTWKSWKPLIDALSPVAVWAAFKAGEPITCEFLLFISKVFESSSFWMEESLALALIFSYSSSLYSLFSFSISFDKINGSVDVAGPPPSLTTAYWLSDAPSDIGAPLVTTWAAPSGLRLATLSLNSILSFRWTFPHASINCYMISRASISALIF